MVVAAAPGRWELHPKPPRLERWLNLPCPSPLRPGPGCPAPITHPALAPPPCPWRPPHPRSPRHSTVVHGKGALGARVPCPPAPRLTHVVHVARRLAGLGLVGGQAAPPRKERRHRGVREVVLQYLGAQADLQAARAPRAAQRQRSKLARAQARAQAPHVQGMQAPGSVHECARRAHAGAPTLGPGSSALCSPPGLVAASCLPPARTRQHRVLLERGQTAPRRTEQPRPAPNRPPYLRDHVPAEQHKVLGADAVGHLRCGRGGAAASRPRLF